LLRYANPGSSWLAMKTLLLANRLAPELSPLTEATCAAMLLVADKPLLMHAVESIAAARLTDIIVVVSPFAEHVEDLLGDGARWGMRFSYMIARRDECPIDLIRRLDLPIGEGLLVVRGDFLRTPIIAEFVARAASIAAPEVTAAIAGISAGVLLMRTPSDGQHHACNLLGLAPDPANRESRLEPSASVDFPAARLATVESLRDFHRANLDAAAGRFPGLMIPGRELLPGVLTGRKTRLPASAITGTPVFVGSRCRVAGDAELMSEVVVSSDVVIDRRATLRSAVIMPHTYIGELVEIADAIVAGDMLIHVDTGAVTRVTDSFLLASVRTPSLASPLRTMGDSLGAMLLLILSIPLWPVALIASLAADPHHPIHHAILLGNRRAMTRRIEFRAYQFSTSLPLLRYLPYLFSVAAGHLRLVGVEPLAPAAAAARIEEWEFVRDEAPAGLLGPVQLTLPADAPREERRLMEAYYARTRSLVGDLRWLAFGAASIFRIRAVPHQVVAADVPPGH
jgi:mannose-1-phosphate guanylyltransferase / phosphomannomutase